MSADPLAKLLSLVLVVFLGACGGSVGAGTSGPRLPVDGGTGFSVADAGLVPDFDAGFFGDGGKHADAGATTPPVPCDQWEDLGLLPYAASQGFFAPLSREEAFFGGGTYTTGGGVASSSMTSTYYLNRDNRGWHIDSGPALPYADNGTPVALANGDLVLAGGTFEAFAGPGDAFVGGQASVLRLDATSHQWFEEPTMKQGRFCQAAVETTGGLVAVFGGVDDYSDPTTQSSAEVRYPDSGWTEYFSPVLFACGQVDGARAESSNLVYTGGWDPDAGGNGGWVGLTFDPYTGAFLEGPPLENGNAQGSVYVGRKFLVIETYDPVDGSPELGIYSRLSRSWLLVPVHHVPAWAGLGWLDDDHVMVVANPPQGEFSLSGDALRAQQVDLVTGVVEPMPQPARNLYVAGSGGVIQFPGGRTLLLQRDFNDANEPVYGETFLSCP